MKKVILLALLATAQGSQAQAQLVTVNGFKHWIVGPPGEVGVPNQKQKCSRGDELELIESTTNMALSGYKARGNSCTFTTSRIKENGVLSPASLSEARLQNGGMFVYHGCVAAVTLDCY